MELEQLRQLDAVARSGTLQAAADELHLSQSALSRSLRRLEDDLGRPLNGTCDLGVTTRPSHLPVVRSTELMSESFYVNVPRDHVLHDRIIFLQQVQTSNLLTFTTNAPENTSRHESRRAIPITDPEAHVTYWLSVRIDAPEQVRSLFDLIQEAV